MFTKFSWLDVVQFRKLNLNTLHLTCLQYGAGLPGTSCASDNSAQPQDFGAIS